MAIDDRMTSANLSRAQGHVETVTSLGADLSLIKAGTKDELGGIITEEILTLKAFPTRFSPYDRDTLRKISWAENTDVIAYVSKKAVENAGYTIENLRRYYKKMRIHSKNYETRYVEPYGAFASDFLYIVIAGKS
jgi:hypothetical protein